LPTCRARAAVACIWPYGWTACLTKADSPGISHTFAYWPGTLACRQPDVAETDNGKGVHWGGNGSKTTNNYPDFAFFMIPEVPEQVTKALVNIDAKILTLVYKDLAQPGVQQVGKALSTVLGLGNTVMLPFKLLNEKAQLLFEGHMEKYRKSLEDVPEERIVEVAPELGVPILERLEKTTNGTLSDLYVNLLTSASLAAKASLAHPRFVLIIESITPDEAKILRLLHEIKTMLPFISALAQEKQDVENAFRSRPVTTVLEKTTELSFSDYLALPDNASLYLNNLNALGLIAAKDKRIPAGDSTLDLLYKHYQPAIQDAGKRFAAANQLPFADVVTTHGYFELTALGKSFMQACHYSS
jgi:hypothetical protein